MSRYIWNILVALDQVLTALLGGWPDESLSSYAYRLEQQGKVWGKVFRPAIDWLFSWYEADHCQNSFQAEKLRHHMPPELRD